MLSNIEFKRKFSLTLYKNLHLKMGEMTFAKAGWFGVTKEASCSG